MVWLRIRSLLARRRGSVALEGILCMMFLIGAFYVMWGAALVVYNQSKVAAGVQFASQGALVVYDRSTYRGGYPANTPGGDGGAYAKAQAAAQSLIDIDGSVGMAPDQFGNAPTGEVMTGFDVNCGSSITGTGSSGGNSEGPACTGGNSAAAAVTRVQVQGGAASSFWLLQPLSHPNGSRQAADYQTDVLNASSTAISAGPQATP